MTYEGCLRKCRPERSKQGICRQPLGASGARRLGACRGRSSVLGRSLLSLVETLGSLAGALSRVSRTAKPMVSQSWEKTVEIIASTGIILICSDSGSGAKGLVTCIVSSTLAGTLKVLNSFDPLKLSR